jgi:transposase
MANPHAIPITPSDADRGQLRGWVRRRKTGQAPASRARIVLACAAPGSTNGGVAEALGVSRPTVALWRRRFAERGLDGLLDEPRPGAPRTITDGSRHCLERSSRRSPPRWRPPRPTPPTGAPARWPGPRG